MIEIYVYIYIYIFNEYNIYESVGVSSAQKHESEVYTTEKLSLPVSGDVMGGGQLLVTPSSWLI